jgi:proline racemase
VVADSIDVVDYHTAGEPFRIVTAGVPDLEGATVLDRRSYAARHADSVRRLVVNEPRGHADMYGCFITPPDDRDADLGVVFFHRDGFSTACGHGTIALVTWAIESGLIEATGPTHRVVVDAPSGRIEAMAEVDGNRVTAVTITNVPSYVSARSIPVQLTSGVVGIDVAYGGAYYASVDAAEIGIPVEAWNLDRFVAVARELKQVLEDNPAVEHPLDDRLSGLYGSIFYRQGPPRLHGVHQRSVTVFADGEVDRSPCGSGTSARLALLDSAAELQRGEILLHESIIGTSFSGRVVGDTEVAGIHAVLTEIRGSAYKTGEARFTVDESDPLRLGFRLR